METLELLKTHPYEFLLQSEFRRPTPLTYFEKNMSQLALSLIPFIILHGQNTDCWASGLYEIETQIIKEFIGWWKSKNTSMIYNAFEELYDNSYKWNVHEVDKRFKLGKKRSARARLIVTLVTPLRKNSIDDRSEDWNIYFALHPEIERIIKDPNVYGKCSIIMHALLHTKKYAFETYAFLADTVGRGLDSIDIDLDDFRRVIGIDAWKYWNYVWLKKDVIQPLFTMIDKTTNISVNRKVTSIRVWRKVWRIQISWLKHQNWAIPMFITVSPKYKRYLERSSGSAWYGGEQGSAYFH